jgi:hypothetical protein
LEIDHTNSSDLLPIAADLMKKIDADEAQRASEYRQKQAAADAEKKALLDQLSKPSGSPCGRDGDPLVGDSVHLYCRIEA